MMATLTAHHNFDLNSAKKELLLTCDNNNNNATKSNKNPKSGGRGKAQGGRPGSKNYEKYSLRPRSIQNRIETEKRRKEEPKKEPKPKQKPPPLSKYRRKTANARERCRMKEINQAFDILQQAVPQYPVLPVNSSGKTCEKLTKITTLRLAMNYIESLKSLLNPSEESDEFSSGTSACSPASSYTMSPLSSPPDCLQAVMRSVVSPPGFAMSPASSCSSSSSSSSSCSSSASSTCSNASSVSINNFSNNNNGAPFTITESPPMNPLLLPHRHGSNQSHSHRMYTTAAVKNLAPPNLAPLPPECLPPPISMSAVLPSSNNSGSNCLSFLTVHHQHIPHHHPHHLHHHLHNSAVTVHDNNNNNRTGSLSSLTESDLSEYASDLLSDEGSTLDDPMFEDLIGVGAVASDFPDLLLDSDGDSLHFSSDLSDN